MEMHIYMLEEREKERERERKGKREREAQDRGLDGNLPLRNRLALAFLVSGPFYSLKNY